MTFPEWPELDPDDLADAAPAIPARVGMTCPETLHPADLASAAIPATAPSLPPSSPLKAPAATYDLFHAVRVLEARFPEAPPVGGGGPARLERVRLRGSPELHFPVSLIAQAGWTARGAALTLRLPGLFGSRSPLPSPYPLEVLQSEDEAPQIRDFLDLFHHRLFGLLYRGRVRLRPDLSLRAGGTDLYHRTLLRLIGITPETPEAELGVPPLRLLHYLSYLLTPTRPPRGLEVLLEDALEVPVRVVPMPLRWVDLTAEQAYTLHDRDRGRGRLGRDIVLGDRVVDRRGCCQIELGPLPFARFETLRPGTADCLRLLRLARFYVRTPQRIRIVYQVPSEELPTARLGEERSSRIGHGLLIGAAPGPLCRLVFEFAVRGDEPASDGVESSEPTGRS